MKNLFFSARKPEFSDGVIDLWPMKVCPAERAMGFGRERVWKIAETGSRKEIGQISYRDGESRCVFYYGHIGYHIDEPWRGNHYALRACLLIRDEIRFSGKSSVVITCDPENLPSRKTCERLGCLYEGTVRVPGGIIQKYEIHHTKRRYIWRTGEPYVR